MGANELPAQRLREQWRSVLDAARFSQTATVITYHRDAVAALIPRSWWEPPTGAPTVRELGVREARIELGSLIDAARVGQHTVILRRGEPTAVLVPYPWYVQRGAE